jgi:radical SAM family uncharacterized protein
MTEGVSVTITRDECYELLRLYGTPRHVVRHDEEVARVAVAIARALNKTGLQLDIPTVLAAGLLHDIARTSEDHALVGADIFEADNPEVAAPIRAHMTHDFNTEFDFDNPVITATDLIALADRSVMEDKYVGYKHRIDALIEKYADVPEARARFAMKMADTELFIANLENVLGKSLDEIVVGDVVDISGLLPLVQKPGRYVGGEINSGIGLTDSLRFCFAFPDVYEIGMSFTGLQIIYGLLADNPNICCERVFAPWVDMEDLMREKNIPLFTLETRTKVKCVDVLGFTLQYEHSYTNIINMLDLAGIHIYTSERGEDEPIVIAGGPCVYNVEPIADIFDAVLIGDAEEAMIEILETVKTAKDAGKQREDILIELSEVDGVYIPSFYQPVYKTADGFHTLTPDPTDEFTHYEKKYDYIPDRVYKRVVKNLENAFFPVKPIVPLVEAVQERAIVEVFRGCGRGCRFCQAGYVYRPIRKRSPEKIKELISAQLDNTGYDEVSLLSLSIGDYPGIEDLVCDLMDDLSKRDVSMSLPSLRLDSISENTLEKIASYKKTGLTFAPEAGTQRLRDVIRKNITEAQIFSTVEKAIGIGWNRMKLYFMIGLPTETYEDLDGIVDLARRIVYRAKMLQEKGRRDFNLTVSVSNFVPKPNTPFQWCAGNSEAELREKNFYLKDAFKTVKGVKFQFHDTRTSHIEMVLAKGDRRILPAIIEAVRLGCRFDSWREQFRYDLWIQAFENVGMDPASSAGTDASARSDASAGMDVGGLDLYTDVNMPLPWMIIDCGVDPSLVASEYEKALRADEIVEDFI